MAETHVPGQADSVKRESSPVPQQSSVPATQGLTHVAHNVARGSHDLLSNPATQELPAEYRDNADRIVSDYLEVLRGEKVLFICNQNPKDSDPRFIEVMCDAVRKKGGDATVFTIRPGEDQNAELEALLASHNVFWIASETSDETMPVKFDRILEIIEDPTKRMADCTGVQVDALADTGVLGERRDVVEGRLQEMDEKLNGMAGFHIKTELGTDLWMDMVSGRPWYKASGWIPRGSWDNLPGGEIFTTPDEDHVDGTLVLTTVHNDVTPERGVDQPVKLTVKDGKIINIEGGESAAKLREYFERNAKLEKDPMAVYSCAEIAFGANANAPAVPEGPACEGWREDGPSAIVTEKRFKSMHIAFGDTNHGGPAIRGKNSARTHLDFVLSQKGLTVHAFKDRGAYEAARAENRPEAGEAIIENGDYRLITPKTPS